MGNDAAARPGRARPAGRSRAAALFAPLLLVLALAGCAGRHDGEEARTCRQLIPILNPRDAEIEVRQTVGIGAGPERGIQIVYIARASSVADRVSILTCRFAAAERGGEPRERLVGVVNDGTPLGALRIALLARHWLASPDAVASDPAPYLRFGRILELPFPLAYGLQLLLSALPMTAIYALLAAAYALIYGLIGRINLAFGELAALAGYGTTLAIALAFSSAGAGGLAIALGLVFALWTVATHAAATSHLVFVPLTRRASGQQSIIATAGLAIALQEYLRLAQGARLTWAPPMLNEAIAIAAAGRFALTVTPVSLLAAGLGATAIALLLAALAWTGFGRRWRAAAEDALAASLLGVDPARMLHQTMLVAAGLAGLAGFVMTIVYGGVGYAGGIVLGLKALIAAVIGGIGSVGGALLGGLLIGLVETAWSALFAIEHRDMVLYGLLAGFLIWRPGGIWGDAGDPPPRR